MVAQDPVRVGVLSLHNSKETKAILNAVDDLGHHPEWLREENVTVSLDADGISLEPDVDVVINRLLLSKTHCPSQGLGLAEAYASTVPIINPPTAVLRALHKFAAASHLTAADVSTPDSVFALSADQLDAVRDRVQSAPVTPTDTEEMSDVDGTPIEMADGGTAAEASVYKPTIGTHGDGTEKLYAHDQVPQTLGVDQGLLQELIECADSDGTHSDIRVYVVDGQVIGAMQRNAPDDDWRTNVARGGSVEDRTADLPDTARQTAVEAAAALNLDCAGVDLVHDGDDWYVLEANPTAGFKGLFEATGISPAPYIARLAIEQAGGTVDDDHVTHLAQVLDDEIPECRPSLRSSPTPSTHEIGFTEPVTICGHDTARDVIAKADTGATRTSIDTELAGQISAGPIVDSTSVKTGSSKQGTTRPLVEVGVRIGDYTHRVTANIEDRSHMSHDVLLGRDILQHYSINLQKRHDSDDPVVPRSREEIGIEE